MADLLHASDPLPVRRYKGCSLICTLWPVGADTSAPTLDRVPQTTREQSALLLFPSAHGRLGVRTAWNSPKRKINCVVVDDGLP